MVATDADLARGLPRRGAKVVRCERATRVVRAYSRDLIVSAELWANEIDHAPFGDGGELSGPGGQSWEAWERVILKYRRGDAGRPKCTGSYRKRLALGGKDHLPLPASSSSSNGNGLSRQMTYGKATLPSSGDTSNSGTPNRAGRERKRSGDEEAEARWGSLAGKEWSMFEEGGFDAADSLGGGSGLTGVLGRRGGAGTGEFGERKGDIKDRLQFDLTEGAKTVRLFALVW